MIATYTRLMLMLVLYVIAAARSTVFVQDSFNRLYSVYDTHVTPILKVFMKMLHLHGICLSPLFVSRCQHPPWKSLDCKVGLAGVGWSVGSKN